MRAVLLGIVLAATAATAPWVQAQMQTGTGIVSGGTGALGTVGAAGGVTGGPKTGPSTTVNLALPTAIVAPVVTTVVPSKGNAGPSAQTLTQPAAGAEVLAVAKPLTKAALAGTAGQPTVAGQTLATAQVITHSAAGTAVRENKDLDSSPQAIGSIYGDGIRAAKTGSSDASDVEAPETAAKAAPILGLRKNSGHTVNEPITVIKKDGTVHPLSYNPATPKVGFFQGLWNGVVNIPNKIRLVRKYMARVDTLVNEAITDDNLWWSINRLQTVSIQEGILRPANNVMVNRWDMGSALKNVKPEDFGESSLSAESRIKLFKRAMDLEEPTLQYQYAFAQNLHNLLHTMSHFLGWTFQERLLLTALKDKSAAMSIWAREEIRHGPVLESVYNGTREMDRPPLQQQGEAPRLPRIGGPFLGLSGMANRALAELAAASAYLTIKANSVEGSPTDHALDGIYRDEVYHYVIMSLVNKYALGQKSRFTRLFRIFRHDLDYRPPAPNDTVIHKSKFTSPLMMFEVAYALNAIDKRIDRFLKAMHPETAKELIGPTRLSQKELDADVAAGKIIPTKFFRMEQNSDLTKAEVDTLARRFPAWFDASERKVKASDIREVLDTYRQRSLTNPRYWLKRKGFKEMKGAEFAGRTVIERELSSEEGTALRLEFESPGTQPVATVVDYAGAGTTLWTARVENLSLLQVGAIMDAEKWEGLAQTLEAKKKDLSYEELMQKMGSNRTYQAAPIAVVHD